MRAAAAHREDSWNRPVWIGGTIVGFAIAVALLAAVLAPVIVEASFGLAGAIVAEAGLSFLGLGAQPPTPSWGSMLNEGRAFILVAPHLTIFPGLAIMLLVVGCNILGDGRRDAFDPKQRGR